MFETMLGIGQLTALCWLEAIIFILIVLPAEPLKVPDAIALPFSSIVSALLLFPIINYLPLFSAHGYLSCIAYLWVTIVCLVPFVVLGFSDQVNTCRFCMLRSVLILILLITYQFNQAPTYLTGLRPITEFISTGTSGAIIGIIGFLFLLWLSFALLTNQERNKRTFDVIFRGIPQPMGY